MNELMILLRFSMVSYCASSRRIAFGGKNGTVVVHDLRATRTQVRLMFQCYHLSSRPYLRGYYVPIRDSVKLQTIMGRMTK